MKSRTYKGGEAYETDSQNTGRDASDHCLCRGICCREGISDVSGGAGIEESCADPEGNSGR